MANPTTAAVTLLGFHSEDARTAKIDVNKITAPK